MNDRAESWKWSCGHKAKAACAECHLELAARVGGLAARLDQALDGPGGVGPMLILPRGLPYTVPTVLAAIAAERRRQIDAGCWPDDCALMVSWMRTLLDPAIHGAPPPRQTLVEAAALACAAIECIDRIHEPDTRHAAP